MTGDDRGGCGDEGMEMEEMLERRLLGRGMIGRRGIEDRSTNPRACRRGLAGGMKLSGGDWKVHTHWKYCSTKFRKLQIQNKS